MDDLSYVIHGLVTKARRISQGAGYCAVAIVVAFFAWRWTH